MRVIWHYDRIYRNWLSGWWKHRKNYKQTPWLKCRVGKWILSSSASNESRFVIKNCCWSLTRPWHSSELSLANFFDETDIFPCFKLINNNPIASKTAGQTVLPWHELHSDPEELHWYDSYEWNADNPMMNRAFIHIANLGIKTGISS